MSAGVAAAMTPPFKFEQKEPSVALGIRLRESTLKRTDAIAKAEGLSRNNVIEHLLRWALDQFEAEKKAAKKG